MRRSLGIMAVLATMAFAFVVPPAGGASGNKYPLDPIDKECVGGDLRYEGPQKLWPPNHKLVSIKFIATPDDPNQVTNLESGGAHDQGTGEDEEEGSGNTPVDVEPPSKTTTAQQGAVTHEHGIRAERAGTNPDGRTYLLFADAQFGDGEECRMEVQVTVPHDQRGGAGWKKSS